ncbi:MAG: hypothetical protein R3325_00550 [Thermoanaerobaculia bacterium]|nr:hypothetical protein [Thermoanaerobaculia bacterium]
MGRIARSELLLALALVCLMLLPAPAPAASHEEAEPETMPILWVSYITAEPGKSGELGRHIATEGGKIYDGLLADGHAISWGVAQGVNHFPGDDWTHLEWVSFTSWAGVNEFVSRFMAAMGAKTPEEMAADQATWDELTVHGSHYDEISRFVHVAGDVDQRPGYILVSYFDAQSMQAVGGLGDLYRKRRAPMMDKLVADGKIIGHGAMVSEIHAEGAMNRISGYVAMSDLGDMDDLLAAEEANMAAMSEEDRKEWMETMRTNFDFSRHSDRILVVLHYNSAGLMGGQEGEE